MPVLAGAEPFFHSGGATGVLLCHGFTGSPATLRPWADYLAAAGLTVSLPRLPGHGTTWQEMNRTRWQDWYAEIERAYADLQGHASEIFAMGISMGACLALRLAEQHGPEVAGLVLVNPSVAPDTKLFLLTPVLKLVVPSMKSIGGDIKKGGSHELSYDRVPVRAAASLPQLWKLTQQRLADITQPVLAYRSTIDHVVGPASMRLLQAGLPAGQLTVRECGNSYHVATLDNDADEIFAGSLEFVRAHSRGGDPPWLIAAPDAGEGVTGGDDGKAADDEAAWRDLVAQYRSPAVTEGAAPWPGREDLPGARAAAAPGDDTDPGLGTAEPPGGDDPVPGVIPALPRFRVVRPALPPQPGQPPPVPGDEEFVPPVPPPLPRLDPVSKGAWAALFGGPGYLLLAVLFGWQIPGWAAFCAVAAFVGGFATLVIRMNDRPPEDGPDDGAVV